MDFEGQTFVPDYRQKEKRLRSTIEEQTRQIAELESQLAECTLENSNHKESIMALKKELAGVRARYRNVKSDLYVKQKSGDVL